MDGKRSIVVSPEFTCYIGRGVCDRRQLPADPVIMGFGDMGEPAVIVLESEDLHGRAGDEVIVFAVNRGTCRRLFGLVPKPAGRWYLPADLRGLGRAIVAVDGEGEMLDMLRAARSSELLCQLFIALRAGAMVEVPGATTLSEEDISRIAAAHQFISEHWHERPTIDAIARRYGLGKTKLTRGFRELYGSTVGEQLSERRLERAREMLSQSDLQISVVGYRCGYLSNASFTRAFVRRFGMAPTEMRRRAQTA